jgi:hypothetical protein
MSWTESGQTPPHTPFTMRSTPRTTKSPARICFALRIVTRTAGAAGAGLGTECTTALEAAQLLSATSESGDGGSQESKNDMLRILKVVPFAPVVGRSRDDQRGRVLLEDGYP